jgi:hypothetical protein
MKQTSIDTTWVLIVQNSAASPFHYQILDDWGDKTTTRKPGWVRVLRNAIVYALSIYGIPPPP